MRNQQNLAVVGPSHIRPDVTGSIRFVSIDTLHFNAQDMYKLIKLRAYERYQARNAHGNDWQDWFVAEREVQLPVPIEEDEEDDNAYVVRADVPGFRENEIEIGRGEKQLIIGGRMRGGVGRPVRKADWIHRSIELPEGLDTQRATAKLSYGRLEIRVPKKAVSP